MAGVTSVHSVSFIHCPQCQKWTGAKWTKHKFSFPVNTRKNPFNVFLNAVFLEVHDQVPVQNYCNE
jgi:hypothetical protein